MAIAVTSILPVAHVGHTGVHAHFIPEMFGCVHGLVQRRGCDEDTAGDGSPTFEDESEGGVGEVFGFPRGGLGLVGLGLRGVALEVC